MASNLVVFGLIALTLHFLLSISWTHIAIRAQSKRRGCSPPPILPHNDWLGLLRFRSLLKARREKRALAWMVETMDLAGQNVDTAQDKMLGHSFIWTRDVENARALFGAQAADFDIDSDARRIALPMIGSGIFNTTGEIWKESRAMLRPHFTRTQVSTLTLEEKHFQRMLANISEKAGNWTVDFDIQPLISNFTLDIATEFLFGTSADSQASFAQKSIPKDDFQLNWDGAAKYFEIRAILRRYCWLYQPRKFRQHCHAIHAFADKNVDAALARRRTKQSQKPIQKKSFVMLDEVVEMTTNRYRLRAECLNVLGASRTSTAGLIQWTFYFLARHPLTYQKLRTVILERFGNYGSADNITYEKLKNCKYLHCCINEVFRIAPVIPIQTRRAVRDTTLPKGGGLGGKNPIFLPKGTEVRQVFYAMCMRKDIWGKDVAVFRPERFEDRVMSSEWMPFGAGPRVCIGRKCYPSSI